VSGGGDLKIIYEINTTATGDNPQWDLIVTDNPDGKIGTSGKSSLVLSFNENVD